VPSTVLRSIVRRLRTVTIPGVTTDSRIDARKAMAVNRSRWDELGARHPDTDYFRRRLERLRNGGSTLYGVEVDEVGDVTGQRLLHLQCHLALESVSWMRRGAAVTAVDYSSGALRSARRIADALHARVRFVEANVMQLADVLPERFDIVYTSWGVLGWLPDIDAWARLVATVLVPGGICYIAEFHPVAWMFDGSSDEPLLRYPYFGDEPLREEGDGSYADRTMTLANRVTYSWYYTLGGVVTALSAAGMHVEFVHEWPRTPEPLFAFLQRDDSMAGEEWYRMRDGLPNLPLSFTLRARRDG
jgi:SAM-dependent methyltransferase